MPLAETYELLTPSNKTGRTPGSGGETAFEMVTYVKPSITIYDVVTLLVTGTSEKYRVMSIKSVAEVNATASKWIVTFVKAGREITGTTKALGTAYEMAAPMPVEAGRAPGDGRDTALEMVTYVTAGVKPAVSVFALYNVPSVGKCRCAAIRSAGDTTITGVEKTVKWIVTFVKAGREITGTKQGAATTYELAGPSNDTLRYVGEGEDTVLELNYYGSSRPAAPYDLLSVTISDALQYRVKSARITGEVNGAAAKWTMVLVQRGPVRKIGSVEVELRTPYTSWIMERPPLLVDDENVFDGYTASGSCASGTVLTNGTDRFRVMKVQTVGYYASVAKVDLVTFVKLNTKATTTGT